MSTGGGSSDKVLEGRPTSARRGIQWDETNLHENAEWLKAHPVTKHIDEPKTPYAEDDGNYPDEDDDDDATADTSWADAPYNALAAKARLETPAVDTPTTVKMHRTEEIDASAPTAARKARGLSIPLVVPHPPAPAEEAEPDEDKQQHEAEFRSMRKAVYADEGKKFLAMKEALQHIADDDEDDQDDDDNARVTTS
jgi:hypothetical protein